LLGARHLTYADPHTRNLLLALLHLAVVTAKLCGSGDPPLTASGQVGADGALRLVVFEGPVAKRYRITPGTDTNIDVVLAAAK
jgi:hypothetical protein